MKKGKINVMKQNEFVQQQRILNFDKSKQIVFALSIITFLINLLFVSRSNMIYMRGHEYGPIAIAAYWSGEDWSSTNSMIGYYS